MKYSILLLSLMVMGCSILKPSDETKGNRHLRKAARHIRLAESYGVHPDTIHRQKTDSAKIGSTELSGNSGKLVNEDSLREYCRQLLRDQPSKDIAVIEPKFNIDNKKQPNNAKKAVIKIQKEVCPQEVVDSTYYIPLVIQTNRFDIPITVYIKANGGHLEWSVKSAEVSAPFVKDENILNITSGATAKEKAMWAFFGGIASLLVFLLLALFNRRRK